MAATVSEPVSSTFAVPPGWFRRHAAFLVLLGCGALLRGLALLGHRPALWFSGDSFSYLVTAAHLRPDLVRPAGYAFLLRALEPFHSFALVAAVQHLMGLAVAVLVYAAAARAGVPRWAAALAAAPVLLSAHQVQLEHLLLSDTLFMLLAVGAVALVPRVHGLAAACGLGALLGAAAITRSVALPLLVLVLADLVRRRVGWRLPVTVAVVALLPVAAYGAWFHERWDRFAITNTGGVFLWARTTTFMDCARLRPPPEEARLCPAEPPGARPAASTYVWSADSPLATLGPVRFTTEANEVAGRLARRAILAQPGDYLAAAGRDLLRTFAWSRGPHPDARTLRAQEFHRDPAPDLPDPIAREAAARYEHGPARTRVVDPYAGALLEYQRYGWLPGPLLGGVLLVGLAGVLTARRRGVGPAARQDGEVPKARVRWGGEGLLLWAAAVTLLALPPLTVDFDHRYVLPAVPLACLAAALAFARTAARRRDDVTS
ncbi:MAG: hypothetical protein GEV11_17440 [Streptosporangiales bacterium]|nr:hypothetical protein [Streptosporangiales bacterium]